MVAGLVLAAGLSRRMGKPKQLLSLGDATLLEHALRVASRSRLSGLCVVLSEPVARGIDLDAYPSVTRVLNPAPEEGQSSSLRLGLAALPEEVGGALVLMCDQPGVTVPLLDRLVEEFERLPAGALVPTYGGRRGTPVLLARPLWPQAMALRGDTGARALLAAHPELVRTVEVGHLGDGEDIDTPEQYERLLRRASPVA